MFINRVLPSFLPLSPGYELSDARIMEDGTQTIYSIYVLFQHRAVPSPLHVC
jgi:hypothetical protein